MQPLSEPNDEERREKLPGDFDTPFSLPDDVASKTSSTTPSTDDQMDSQELYDQGLPTTSGDET